MQEGSGVTNLQTELNYLDSFKSYCNSSDLGFLSSGGVGQVGGGCLGLSAIVYMSSGMFRGKESSNRIELSRLVMDLLNFGVLDSLQLWGWRGGWMLGGWLGVPPHTCTCMHTCTCRHIYKLNMIISIANGSPHWGNPWEFPMMSYVHACVCACVGGTLSPPPIPPPLTPRGDPQNQSKFNST